MSKHNDWFNQLEVLRVQLVGARLLYYDPQELDMYATIDPFLEKNKKGQFVYAEDRETWVDALIMWALVVNDLPRRSTVFSVRDWLNLVSTIPVRTVCKVLKDFDAKLLKSVGNDTQVIPPGLNSGIPCTDEKTSSIILSPVSGLISDFTSPSQDVSDFKQLHQFFAFITRVTLRCMPSKPFVEDYLNNERTLAQFEENFESWLLLGELRSIISDWLKDFKVEGLPTHSSGSIAHDVLPFDKAESKPNNHSLLRKYLQVKPDELLGSVMRNNGIDPDHYTWSTETTARVSKLQFVPKDALKTRQISMEPATLQFEQHRVQGDLYRYFRTNSDLRKRIDLQNSNVNRELAREGSIDGSLATVDLSHASDSVSWLVVKSVFAGTALRPWLSATRSIYTEVPGLRNPVELNKYAPMGSALCFPIECLIFAAVCQRQVYNHWYHLKHSKYHVYGDDIVIETELVSDLQHDLNLLGFEVNDSKTFADPGPFCFRESCGGEFYFGEDVLPLRISRKFRGGKLSVYTPDKVVSLKDLINSAHEYGYYSLRNYLITRLRKHLPTDLFPIFGYVGGFRFGDDNWSKPSRWNANLQREEIKGPVIVDMTVKRQIKKQHLQTLVSEVPLQFKTQRDRNGHPIVINVVTNDEQYGQIRLDHWFLRAALRREPVPDLCKQAFWDCAAALDVLFCDPVVSLIGDTDEHRGKIVLSSTWFEKPVFSCKFEYQEQLYQEFVEDVGVSALPTDNSDSVQIPDLT